MSFIEKLKKIEIEDRTMRHLKDMVVGTYNGYLENGKQESLDVLVKLSYLLGKETGKELARRRDWKNEKKN